MTIRSIDDTVAIMKDEILHDIHSGLVPRSVRSFSELHQYTDANFYGGFCDRSTEDEDSLLDVLLGTYGYDETGGMAEAVWAYINACQDAVNTWLAQAGHLLDDMQDQNTASMMD